MNQKNKNMRKDSVHGIKTKTTKKWSDFKKWIMGLLATIIVLIIGFVLKMIFSPEINTGASKLPIETSIQTAKYETQGKRILDSVREKRPNLFLDNKSTNINEKITNNVVKRLDVANALLELESLLEGKLELTINYLEKEIEKTDNTDLLVHLLAELATLEYLNNNLFMALELYKVSNDLMYNSDISYQIERLEELLNQENLLDETQTGISTLKNNNVNIQSGQIGQGDVIVRNINPLNKNVTTHEDAPLLLILDQDTVSATQPFFGTTTFNKITKALIYTPEIDYNNSCNSYEDEKDTFTYTKTSGLEGIVQVTVLCVRDLGEEFPFY